MPVIVAPEHYARGREGLLLFYRVLEQAVASEPATHREIVHAH